MTQREYNKAYKYLEKALEILKDAEPRCASVEYREIKEKINSALKKWIGITGALSIEIIDKTQ